MSLEELIQNCKKQQRKAQEHLYKLYCNKLFALCLKYSRNKEEAEDNLQDAFLTIFKKINTYNSIGSFEGWLKRITINTILQKYRKKNVFNIVNDNIEEEEEIILEVTKEQCSLDFLLKIIQELPDRYRITFTMYVLDGYSHKEIAEMLKISEGTSKSNLARARILLKKKLEAQHPNTQFL